MWGYFKGFFYEGRYVFCLLFGCILCMLAGFTELEIGGDIGIKYMIITLIIGQMFGWYGLYKEMTKEETY